MEEPIQRIREAIEQQTGPGRPSSRGGWQLKCPAHADRNPSLSLDANPDHHVLLYCQAGCDTDAILAAIGMTRRDLYPVRDTRTADPVVATYRYVDENGELLYEVQRTAAKRFRQRRPDPAQAGKWIYKLDGVARVLYRLPQVLAAAHDGLPIYLVEGEKDVHTLERDGHAATTNPGGAGKWRPEYTQALHGAHVHIVADLDSHGRGLAHARAVAAALAPVAASVALLQPAAGKDYTDHHTAGFGVDDLVYAPPEVPGRADEPAGDPTEAAVDPLGDADNPADDTHPAPPVNPIRLVPASTVRMRPARWLWDGRIPLGEITLVPGREGIGKSIFLAWMAAAITQGTLPGVYEGEPRAVLYAAAEDAWDYTIAPRMHAAGADLSMVYRVDVLEGEDGIPGGLNLPKHCRYLPERAGEVKAAVLMCDPILSTIDETIDPNKSRELRVALEPLRRAAEQAEIAAIGLAHFNKNSDADILSKVAGSRAWSEVARAVIAIAREKRDEPGGNETNVQIVSQIKNNMGNSDLPSLEYRIEPYAFPLDDHLTEIRTGRLAWLDGESMTTAEEVLARRPGQRGGGTAGYVGQVLDVLDEAPAAMSPKDVADAIGPDGPARNTIKQILWRLAQRGEIVRVGDGLYRGRTVSMPPT